MTPMNDVAELRKQLLRNGFTPLPNVGKTTYLEKWPSVVVTPELIDDWSRKRKRWQDTGIRVQDGLCVFDVDIDDREMGDDIYNTLVKEKPQLEGALVRFGKGAKEAWFFRCSDTFTRIFSRRWFKPGEGDPELHQSHAVECFGGASPRQFGAFGAHTRNPDGSVAISYEWAEGASPLTVPLAELPELSKADVFQMVDRIEQLLEAAGWVVYNKSMRGESEAVRVYDLTPEMQFECNDGVTRSLAELQEAAGEPGLRCSASWLEPARGHSLTRCLVGRSHDGKLTLWDAASGVTHMPADKAPPDRIELHQDIAALATKLDRAKETEDERKMMRRMKLSIEDDFATVVAKLLSTYALCPGQRLEVVPIYATSTEEGMTLTNFRHSLQRWVIEELGPRDGIHKINPADAWLSSPQLIVVEGLRLRPDQPRPLFKDRGKQFVNTYAPEVHDAQGGSADTAIEFLRRLIPDDGERAFFIAWLAYKFRNPHIPGPAIVMVARSHGTGRGTLGELVRRLFGARYVKTIGFDHFAGRTYQSQYTEWRADSLVVLVNESSTADSGSSYRTKHDTYERLKEIVDPRPQFAQIVAKGIRAYETLICASYIIATNNPDALPIPKEDRRFWVALNGEPQTPEYYEEVNAWADDPANIAAFARWLEEQDISGYSPYAPPPITEAKRSMTMLSDTDVDRGFELAIANLTADLMVDAQVFAAMSQAVDVYGLDYPDRWRPIVKRMLQSKLYRIGVPNGTNWHPQIDGKRYAVYAKDKRTATHYTKQEAEVVRREVLRNGSPAATGLAGNVLRGLFREAGNEEK